VYPAVGPLHRHSWRHPLRRTGWALTAFGVAFALVAVFARGASAETPRHHRSTTTPRPQRLLVLSLPATSWADLDPAVAPHLVQLLDHSAVADLATAGLDTVAIRIPAHPVAREILRVFGGPVVAPSANISGHVSPTTAAHVQSDLVGRIELIVDGGPVAVGVESTVVGCFDAPMLLRPGGVPRAEIERVLDRRLVQPPADAGTDSVEPLAPGMLTSHYAPRAKVRLNAQVLEPGEALLAFGLGAISGIDAASAVMNLSERGDVAEAAANLFGHLRALDGKGVRTIAVMPIPNEGLGEAINDRLRRAAVGRE